MINDCRLLMLATAAITNVVATRIYIGVPPATTTLPRITCHQMGSDEQNDLTNSGVARAVEVEFDCEGATAQDSYTLAEILRLFWKDFSGPAGSITIDAVSLDDVHEKPIQKTTQPNQTRQFAVTVPATIFYRP